MPFQALRVMAGFEKEDGYWLPRCRCLPPDELRRKMWPFVDEVLHYLEEFKEETSEFTTTHATFSFFDFLRTVVLQDAATMFVLAESGEGLDRRTCHHIFSLPLFHCDEFRTFVSRMREKLIHESLPENDPTTKDIDKCLPGVNQRFHKLTQDMKELKDTVLALHGEREIEADRVVNSTEASMHKVVETIKVSHHHMMRQHQRMYKSVARAMNSFGSHGVWGQAEGSAEDNHGADGENSVVVEFGPTGPRIPHEGLAMDEEVHEMEIDHGDVEVGDGVDAMRSYDDELENFRDQKPSFMGKNTKGVSIRAMYNEYYGLEEFYDGPIIGGFHYLETTFKNKWRKGYQAKEGTMLSRWKTLVKGFASACDMEEGEWNERAEALSQEWDVYIEKGGLAGAVRNLQAVSLIAKPRPKSTRTA